MDLLQKITLYDLLGYALPGCVLLWLWRGLDICAMGEVSLVGVIVFVGLGYLLGILISEMANLALRAWKRSRAAKRSIEERMQLNPSAIKKALRGAGVLPKRTQLDPLNLMWKYLTYMYMDIQCDHRYSRIHNYASAELMYKNMAFVSMIGICVFWQGNQYLYVAACGISMALFLMRWWRFEQKRVIYTVYWFVGKYVEKKSL